MPNGEHGDGDGKEFEGRTYLYIRTHTSDNGSEPLAAGLPGWLSPDIQIIQPNGSVGAEAIAGQENQVRVIVTNAGGIDAVDAWVDVYFADPSTVIIPATATLIGAGPLSIPGYSLREAVFPWTPLASDAGHRCLLARVALFLPPDAYVNGTIFDVIGDRHVAQRNIHVVAMAQAQKNLQFAFAAVNPNREAARFTLMAREVRDATDLEQLRAGLGCGFAQFGETPLRGIRLIPGNEKFNTPRRENPMELLNLSYRLAGSGVLQREGFVDARGQVAIELDAGEVQQMILTLDRNPDTRAGDLHAVAIAQLDEKGSVMGGLTVVVRH